MLVECFVICGLILVVVVGYLRAKKKDYAMATLPLIILPLANVLSYFVSGGLAGHLPIDKFTVYAGINIISALVSSCLVGMMSSKFAKRYTRAAYILMSLIFNIVLAAILTYNMFEALYR